MESMASFTQQNNYSVLSTLKSGREIFRNNLDQQITYRKAFILPLIVIALFGNSIIILTKLKKFMVKKINDNDLIGIQLAICDILRATFFCLVYLRNQWKGSALSCTVIQKILLILFSVCNMMTLYLTYLRYRVIRYPFSRAKRQILKKSVILVFIWIGHIAIFTQRELFELDMHKQGEFSFCQSKSVQYFSHSPGLIAEITILSLLTLLSVIAITILLTLIFNKLKGQKLCASSVSSTNIQKRNQRSVKILVSMYIAYITSYVPWIVMYLLNSVEMKEFNRVIHQTWFTVILWFIAGSFCNTFLTLLLYSKKFINETKSIWFFKKKHYSSTKFTAVRNGSDKANNVT